MMKRYVVEKSVGDNTCHDVRVSKGMDFGNYLEALWECRVEVSEERYTYADRIERTYKPVDGIPGKKGLPTFARVEAQLEKAGFEIHRGEYGTGGISADDLFGGCVRVRIHGYPKTVEQIKAARDIVSTPYLLD